jgi:putative addiction module killer protein
MTETHARTVLTYKTVAGKEPFEDWLDGLDKGVRARVRTRIARLRTGNFGDIKPVGEGVSELRLSFGAGYRVYLAQDGDALVVLLCGGDKSAQAADIQAAKRHWRDYRRRKAEAT